MAFAVDTAVRASRQDEWRSNPFKVRRVRNAVVEALKQAGSQPTLSPDGATGHIAEPHGVFTTEPAPEFVQRVMDLMKNQNEY